MVRLKERETEQAKLKLEKSQSHYGSIKRIIILIILIVTFWSQSHYGSIKRGLKFQQELSSL